MKVVEKPWGYEEIWAKTDAYVGKIINIKLGHRLSLQYHELKEETIRVIDGVLYVWEGKDSDCEPLKLLKGQTYHVKPGQVHRFGSINERGHSNVLDQEIGCSIVEVSTNFLDDVVRLEDDYNR